MLKVGNDKYRGIEVVDSDGDVLLTIEMLPDGDVFLEARVYNKKGQVIAIVDDRGAQEFGGAQVITRAGPPG